MKTLNKSVVAFVALLVSTMNIAWASTSQQEQLMQLSQQKRVVVNATIAPTTTIVPNQQVVVNIEVMTDTWFTKGTRVHRFDVHNALVMQRSSFATNSIERTNGRKYSKQVWEMVVYPLEEGRFYVPSIVIDLAVRGDEGNVAGQLITQPFEFDVEAMTAVNEDANWIVGENSKFTQVWTHIPTNGEPQQFSHLDELELHVGDAIERTVTYSIDNATATLIPKLLPEFESSQIIKYTESSQYQDTQNRGVYSASRIDKEIYVINDAGQVQIPDNELSIWSPSADVAKTVVLGGVQLDIKHTTASYIRMHWMVLSGVLVGSLALIVLIILSINKYQTLAQKQALPIGWLFFLSVWKREDARAEALLYRKRQQNKQLVLLEATLNNRQTEGSSSDVLIGRWQQAKYQNQAGEVARNSRRTWIKLWFAL
ncbi:BatD family protein [Vibrio maerlii]|uniref:BatD family protein n=1 Tax=Vibrio maerlii TaxID=2231648 RepID=UPI000E3B7683|nr:BatD family protein [Vibrio maerlii]